MTVIKRPILFFVLLAMYKNFNKLSNHDDELTGKYSARELALSSVARRLKHTGFMGYRLSSSKWFKKRRLSCIRPSAYLSILLLCAGDIETNPGPSNIMFYSHKLNWLSTLRKIYADEQVNHKICAQAETFTALALAIFQLAIVSSVAASVVRSLLLISGDVEENPGPGVVDINSVDNSQVLDANDLADVMEEVISLKSLYYSLGRALKLDTADLRAIRDAFPSESDAEQALEDVLLLWLNYKYNVERYGRPTWKMLVKAVDMKSGGNDHELAERIASNHPADTSKASDAASPSATSLQSEVTMHSWSAATKDKKGEANREEEHLGIHNMREVLDYFWDYRSKWKLLGIGLGIDSGTLDCISKNQRDVEDCLIELIKVWLRGKTATMSVMSAVLQSKPVAGEVPSAPDELIHTPAYAQYLKSLYKFVTQVCSSEDQWPPPVTDKIFRLAMIAIKTEEQVQRMYAEDSLVREKTITGKVDDVLEHKTPIELKDIFKKIEGQRKAVLIEGAPGAGKSTLSLYICQQWEELFQEYALVILIRLRESSIQCAKSIAELLPRRNDTMGQDIEKEITNNDGRNVLFIFDGWDEIPHNTPARSMILNLVKGAKLQQCSIIVTSRPTSTAHLHSLVSARIEILGFTKKELHHYILACLHNNIENAYKLLQIIKANPILEGTCYLPLNASILVHLFKYRGNALPTTQYGIFTELVCCCIYRHLKKSGKDIDQLTSLDELPPEVDEQFQEVCAIAYKGIMEDTVIFQLDSKFNTLGLLHGVESFTMCGKSYSHNFLHLSIQELLASIHMATKLNEREQTEQFKNLFNQPRFSAIFQFFSAKTKLKTSGISDIVKQVARKCAVDRPQSQDRTLLVSLIHCLFEAQDSSLCQLVVDELKSKLNLGTLHDVSYGSTISLDPTDCYCLGYFLTFCKDFEVHLAGCSIRDIHCKSLFRQGQVYEFQGLNLRLNNIGDEGALAIANAMKTTAINLKWLHLWENFAISDVGEAALGAAAKQTGTWLKLGLPPELGYY